MQGVLVLVERVGLQRLEGVVRDELLFGVHDHGLDGAGRQRPLAQALDVLHLAHVHEHGDDVVAVLLLHVRDQRRRVQAPRVGQYALLFAHLAILPVLLDRRRRLSAAAVSLVTMITVSSPATHPEDGSVLEFVDHSPQSRSGASVAAQYQQVLGSLQPRAELLQHPRAGGRRVGLLLGLGTNT